MAFRQIEMWMGEQTTNVWISLSAVKDLND